MKVTQSLYICFAFGNGREGFHSESNFVEYDPVWPGYRIWLCELQRNPAYVVKDSLVDLDLVREGEKPEIYTEEHEKLLGTYENEWVLFVDGYDSNGNRIYDQVTGKTCHQCRQETLGHHATCSSFNLVQGQFCGDCLFMSLLIVALPVLDMVRMFLKLIRTPAGSALSAGACAIVAYAELRKARLRLVLYTGGFVALDINLLLIILFKPNVRILKPKTHCWSIAPRGIYLLPTAVAHPK